jgi:hypothetical protein
MPNLYAGVYFVVGPDSKRSIADSRGKSASLYEIARDDEFPYDVGDDPGFFSARRHGGRVTWGVCRPDVRNAIKDGDWMIFFSAERPSTESAITRYRFVAALAVDQKVSQTHLFDSPPMRPYRRYLNLLIRRKASGWEHYEPGLDSPSKGHPDWLWRLSDGKLFRKAELVAAGASHRPGDSLSVRGIIPVASNYVIFANSGIVAVRPPLVAGHSRGDRTQTWNRDRCSEQIRDIVFEGSTRSLRTTNPYQPHRHFRRAITDMCWLDQLKNALGNNWRQAV